MDLKFTFGGASPDHHDHGDAPSGVSPLPFSVAGSGPVSSSSVLEVRLSIEDDQLVADALSGDGVSYARATKRIPDRSPSGLASAARSVLARAGAELGDPLLGSVSAVVLTLDGAGSGLLAEFGIAAANPAVDEALQRRTGIAVGTPILIA